MTVFFIILLVVLFYFFVFYSNKKLYVHRISGVGYYLLKTYHINNIKYYSLKSTETGTIIDINSSDFIKNFKVG